MVYVLWRARPIRSALAALFQGESREWDVKVRRSTLDHFLFSLGMEVSLVLHPHHLPWDLGHQHTQGHRLNCVVVGDWSQCLYLHHHHPQTHLHCLHYQDHLPCCQCIDVSKTAQWEVVFEHADHMGLHLHFKTQETKNNQLFGWWIFGFGVQVVLS